MTALPDSAHVLVTGGSGFLGGGIVKSLLKKHPRWTITVLDLADPDPSLQSSNVGFVRADVTSQAGVDTAFAALKRRPDLVMHCAGVVPARNLRYSSSSEQWAKVKAINYEGTQHIVHATKAAGCPNLVYTSSCTAVIDDLDHDYYHMDETTPLGLATLHYGKSKGLAEQFVLAPEHAAQGLTACALRPATIIGEGDTAVVGLIYDLIAKGETYFIIGDGDNIYDFMYIDNAVDAHVLAIENLLSTRTAAGQAFFISNQEPVYFWDFLAAVWAQFGHVPGWRVNIPMGVAWLTGWLFEWVTWLTGGASTVDRGSVKDAVRTQYSNNGRAMEVLGYVPKVSMAEAVKRSCDDYKRRLARLAEQKKIK